MFYKVQKILLEVNVYTPGVHQRVKAIDIPSIVCSEGVDVGFFKYGIGVAAIKV